MLKRILIIVALVATVALPFLLRPDKGGGQSFDESLVIITPHNEAIRHEFGLAFQSWYRKKTGRSVFIDWRVIGGTSEIARFLEGEYTAAFQNHWTKYLAPAVEQRSEQPPPTTGSLTTRRPLPGRRGRCFWPRISAAASTSFSGRHL